MEQIAVLQAYFLNTVSSTLCNHESWFTQLSFLFFRSIRGCLFLPPPDISGGRGGGCFYFCVYSMVESIYLLCLVVSRLKGVLVI